MPEIEVIVPVHTPTRPIRRLAASVLQGSECDVRLRVIAHNTDPAGIRAALHEHADDPRVEVTAFDDGVHSPAGPLAFALADVSAPWFTKIDSDDHLARGALDSWLATAHRHRADVVMPRMVQEPSGVDFPTPPRRMLRTMLEPAKDRLAYRTSTMGLLASGLAPLAVPVAGLETGEDIAPSLRLWFESGRIAMADRGFPYIVGEGAGDRVTAAPRPMRAELAFVGPLTLEGFWGRLSEAEKTSIVAKLIRVQLFGAAGRSGGYWADETVEAVREALPILLQLAPRVSVVLSRVDSDLVGELMSAAPERGVIDRLVTERRRYLGVRPLTTRPYRRTLARDAPLRFLAASFAARHFQPGLPDRE
ncbi:glycosyltransferase [Agromyces sp. NPDC058064]|uniref:glycosyltransferase n=1 Tax=Agromyces sp. NPDC058064 TaxID=3346322 RepID=UPI0036D94668